MGGQPPVSGQGPQELLVIGPVVRLLMEFVTLQNMATHYFPPCVYIPFYVTAVSVIRRWGLQPWNLDMAM